MVSTLALGIFASYFSTILVLFTLIVKNLAQAGRVHKSWSRNQVGFYGALTLCSFAHTWYYMFKFLHWSFDNYEKALGRRETNFVERLSSWLSNTDLFEQAWKTVCFGPFNWWWSEQLCLFTVGAWTAFLAVKGRQHRIRHPWAYMIFGQFVAISVAFNLFNIALALSPEIPSKDEKDNRVPPLLWASVFLSLATIALTPFTNDATFLPNLLVMHVLIILPLLSNTPFIPSRFSISLGSVYFVSYIAALLMRTYTLWVAGAASKGVNIHPLGFLLSAADVLHSHPAQSSIGWDVIWTTISFFIWVVHNPSVENKNFEKFYLIFSAPLISIGVVAPDNLFNREKERKKFLERKRD